MKMENQQGNGWNQTSNIPPGVSTSSKTPLLEDSPDPAQSPEETVVDDNPVPEPETKKAKPDDDSDKDDDFVNIDLNTAVLEAGEGYVMTIDLDFSSNRQWKQFMRDPALFLAKEVNGAEVQYRRLSPEDRVLFENATETGEVSSFVKTEAVRQCLGFEESQKARQSNRVLRVRWVLVWKDVPEEDRDKALEHRKTNALTTYNKDLTKKAKARIVLLGVQHPDLERPDVRTTSPVQSQLMKHLSLFAAAQREWALESSLDMKTAFLPPCGRFAWAGHGDNDTFLPMPNMRQAVEVDHHGVAANLLHENRQLGQEQVGQAPTSSELSGESGGPRSRWSGIATSGRVSM